MVERVSVPPDVAWVDDGRRVVVVRLGEPAADPLVLEGSAAAVWRAIGDGVGVDELVAAVAEAYAEEVPTVEPGVRAMLDEALRSHIVDVQSAG